MRVVVQVLRNGHWKKVWPQRERGLRKKMSSASIEIVQGLAKESVPVVQKVSNRQMQIRRVPSTREDTLLGDAHG